MVSRVELKARAKETLKGNWGLPIGTTLIYGLINFGVIFVATFIVTFLLVIALGNSSFSIGEVESIVDGVTDIFSLILQLFLAPLTVGFYGFFINFSKNEEAKIGNIFDGYKKSFGSSMLAMLAMGVFIFLWSLLLIVPGIIKSYAYSMTYYIIADEPGISASDAIKKSQEMMKGHKWELCVLQLSFLGWGILSVCTCYIGFLWLVPYMQTATANFYSSVKAAYEAKRLEIQI